MVMTSDKMNTNSAIISRNNLASLLGSQFGGTRDLYDALGYPKNLYYKDYVAQYSRQDVAAAVIDRPTGEAWRDGFEIIEKVGGEETEFEKSFKDIYEKFKLQGVFQRVDRLTCLGHWGVLFLGLNDVTRIQDLREPVDINDNLELIYIKPLGESSSEISEWETDINNERYGLPKLYNITINNPAGAQDTSYIVHHSRIIHITKDLLESEVTGTPVLRTIFNRLMDLEKISGGSGEMYWLGARPGYQAITKDGYTLPTDIADTMKDQFDEWENKLRRILTLKGVEMEALDTQISDPKEHVNIQLQLISAYTGIPLRILTGSESGELASSQDRNNWLETVHAWRTNHAEPDIIDKFILRMIEFGILPEVDYYTVVWDDLFSTSEQAKVDIGKNRAFALEAYLRNPMASKIITPDVFIKYFLGLDTSQLEIVEGLLGENKLEDLSSIIEEQTIAQESN